MRSQHDDNASASELVEAIPFVPFGVDLRRLGPNGKLLSDEKIQEIQSKMSDAWAQAHDGRYSKKALRDGWGLSIDKGGIIKQGDEWSAMAPGMDDVQATNSVPHPGHAGGGGFGIVKHTQNLMTSAWRGLKVLKQRPNRPGHTQEVQNEANILEAVGQGSAVLLPKFHSGLEGGWSKPKKLYLSMEFIRGKELFSIVTEQTVSPVFLLSSALQMFKVMHALHQGKYHYRDPSRATGARIIHRDIKIENFIFNVVTNRLEPIDWGYAVVLPPGVNSVEGSRVGTEGFVPPEITRENGGDYSVKTDTFTIGRTLQDILGLYQESVGYNAKDHPIDVGLTQSVFSENLELWALAKDLTKRNPNDRIGLDKAILRMEKIYRQLASDYPVAVVMCDLKQYQAMDVEQKAIFKKELVTKKAQLLLTADEKTTSPLDLIKIKRELEEAGTTVRDDVLIKPTPDRVQRYFASLSKQQQFSFEVFQYNSQNKLEPHSVYSIKANHLLLDQMEELKKEKTSTLRFFDPHRARKTEKLNFLMSVLEKNNKDDHMLADTISAVIAGDAKQYPFLSDALHHYQNNSDGGFTSAVKAVEAEYKKQKKSLPADYAIVAGSQSRTLALLNEAFNNKKASAVPALITPTPTPTPTRSPAIAQSSLGG